MSDWQSISTAPKDGRQIILWLGEYAELFRWDESREVFMTTEGFPIKGEYPWQPIPEPPND